MIGKVVACQCLDIRDGIRRIRIILNVGMIGNTAQAIEDFDQALRLDPDYAHAYNSRVSGDGLDEFQSGPQAQLAMLWNRDPLPSRDCGGPPADPRKAVKKRCGPPIQ